MVPLQIPHTVLDYAARLPKMPLSIIASTDKVLVAVHFLSWRTLQHLPRVHVVYCTKHVARLPSMIRQRDAQCMLFVVVVLMLICLYVMQSTLT